EAGVPTQKSDAAGRQVIGEIVLGEIDLVVRGDHRDLRLSSHAAVIQPLAWVSAGAGASTRRRRQTDEFPDDSGCAGGASHSAALLVVNGSVEDVGQRGYAGVVVGVPGRRLAGELQIAELIQ